MKKRRKCLNCKTFFIPDPRNTHRQRYCKTPACRRASKAASQQRWTNKPENKNYFRGPAHVARVQDWRKAHPNYARKSPPQKRPPLQEPLPPQAVDFAQKSDSFAIASLQDAFHTQVLVLTGLIAKFTDTTLQDSIAATQARLLRLGRDIVGGHRHPLVERGESNEIPLPDLSLPSSPVVSTPCSGDPP